MQSLERNFVSVRQGSILEVLLFNIFLCDRFFIISETDFASCANDNTPYRTENTFISKASHKVITLSRIMPYCRPEGWQRLLSLRISCKYVSPY